MSYVPNFTKIGGHFNYETKFCPNLLFWVKTINSKYCIFIISMFDLL